MRAWPAVLALLAVAGCGQPAPEQTAQDPPAAQTSNPAPSTAVQPAPPSLSGEWRIAGVGGKPIDLPHAISASIGANRIKVSSQCVTMEWSYRFKDQRLVTEPIPITVCDRGRYPEELAIEAALDAATNVVRTPGNGLEIAGGRGSVLLFSQ